MPVGCNDAVLEKFRYDLGLQILLEVLVLIPVRDVRL
jgi:hypothetical protein